MKLYKAYNFRTKDPVIDELRTIVQDHFKTRKLTGKLFKRMEEAGGPAAGTIYNWFSGDTLRPQSAALEAAGRSIGFERVWRKMK